MRFKGYHNEVVPADCSVDGFRIHVYAVSCYLEDDTFVVKEFGTPNSGMWQGVVLKRTKCFDKSGNPITWRQLQ